MARNVNLEYKSILLEIFIVLITKPQPINSSQPKLSQINMSFKQRKVKGSTAEVSRKDNPQIVITHLNISKRRIAIIKCMGFYVRGYNN